MLTSHPSRRKVIMLFGYPFFLMACVLIALSFHQASKFGLNIRAVTCYDRLKILSTVVNGAPQPLHYTPPAIDRPGRFVFEVHIKCPLSGISPDSMTVLGKKIALMITRYAIPDSLGYYDTAAILFVDPYRDKSKLYAFIPGVAETSPAMMQERAQMLINILPFVSAADFWSDSLVLSLQKIPGVSPAHDMDNYAVHLGFVVWDFVDGRKPLPVSLHFTGLAGNNNILFYHPDIASFQRIVNAENAL